MDCAFCGERSTLVRIDSNGEEMVLLLNAGWCFQLMIIGGPHLKLTVYCPTCSIKEVHSGTYNKGTVAVPELCTECFYPSDPFLGPNDSCSHLLGCSQMGNDKRHDAWLENSYNNGTMKRPV